MIKFLKKIRQKIVNPVLREQAGLGKKIDTLTKLIQFSMLPPGGGASFESTCSPNQFEQPLCCTSQICNAEFFGLPLFQYWMDRLKRKPVLHRKVWEWAYITHVLYENGFLKAGNKGLVFGVGIENLPALFASMGCAITATDLDIKSGGSTQWQATNQHSGSNVNMLNSAGICPEDIFKKNVCYRNVDMNNIPDDLRDFDFNWSSCALEHIGGLQKSLDFMVNNLDTLRSGGLAVHTTEFNLSSNTDTLEDPNNVILREKDILSLVEKLTDMGHYVYPLDLKRGASPGDRFVDIPPYFKNDHPIHLRLLLDDYITTSIGLIIRRK